MNSTALLLGIYPPIIIGALAVMVIAVLVLRHGHLRTRQMHYFVWGAVAGGLARALEQVVYGAARLLPVEAGWLAGHYQLVFALKTLIATSVALEVAAIVLIMTGVDRLRLIVAGGALLYVVSVVVVEVIL